MTDDDELTSLMCRFCNTNDIVKRGSDLDVMDTCRECGQYDLGIAHVDEQTPDPSEVPR